MNRDKLSWSIQQHEGFVGVPYPDTQGKTTIGYGRNLIDNPLTPQEGLFLMQRPLEAAIDNAQVVVKNYTTLNDARQNVLIEMCYNMGLYGVLAFKLMRAAIEADDYEEAAKQMLTSKWAGQVGQRARTLAEQMRTGEFAL